MLNTHYHETKRYRCLVEYQPFPSDALYLTMCGIESCIAGKSFGPARRKAYHLHVILSGKGTFEKDGQKVTLHAGQMFIIRPDENVYYFADQDDPWVYCWMTYDGTEAEKLTALAGFRNKVSFRSVNADTSLFYNLVDEALSNMQLSTGASLHRAGLLAEFLALAIHSNHKQEDEEHKKPSASQSRIYIEYAVDFIRRNYAVISVNDVGDYLGISRGYLTRLFQEELNCTPRDYLKYVRMRRSTELLTSTTLPIQEVADMIGYEDQLTFSKAFKKVFGMSPKNYREAAPEERLILEPIIPENGDIE